MNNRPPVIALILTMCLGFAFSVMLFCIGNRIAEVAPVEGGLTALGGAILGGVTLFLLWIFSRVMEDY